jgi:uncharacterized membrane protein YkvA (DUF1232 family)
MYAKHYSASGFWGKLSSIPENTGCTIIRMAITLYVLLAECDLSILARTSIVAGLGYFILPFDCVPDFLPFGLLDDLAILTLLVAEMSDLINPKINERINDYMPLMCKEKG